MSWSNLDYNWAVKHHVVHDSVAEIAKIDVNARHGCTPVSETPLETFNIDPGGMIFMKSVLREVEIDSNKVCIRPELILNALITWTRHRVLEDVLPSGERVIKVYCGRYNVAVMPESLYQKIGSWLASGKTAGYLARMEIVEALADAPNIVVTPPPSEGEA